MTLPINFESDGYGYYVQVPFCIERCDYCSIPVSARPDKAASYIEALAQETERISSRFERTAPSTFYVGGGTPTALPISQIEDILDLLPVARNSKPEITLEARPESLSNLILERIEKKGVNRLSLGIEGVSENQMKFLGRRTTSYDPLEWFERFRSVFHGKISLDFIVGGDGYDPVRFRTYAEKLYALGLDHLSVYPLSIEPRTVLRLKDSRGELPDGLDDATAENWRKATEDLRAIGWHHYEVSNFARSPDSICRHNVLVWKGGDYLGVGAGAHQKVGRIRTSNVRSIVSYEQALKSGNSPFEEVIHLTDYEVWIEYLYTNARLTYGIHKDRFVPYVEDKLVSDYAKKMIHNGWIDPDCWEEGRLKFSYEGWLWLDELVGDLVSLTRT